MSLGLKSTAMPQDAATSAGRNGSGKLDLAEFSQEDLTQFAGGIKAIAAVAAPDQLLSLYDAMHELDPTKMTPGEMLITYDIMHNPVVEAIASVHARDAMAFANDVMINLVQIEQMQQKAQSLGSPYDWDDDDDDNLSPEEKAKRRDQKLANAIADAAQDAHEEKMEQQKKEFTKQEEDFLRNQKIKINGTESSAWQWGKTIDNILGDWDKSYNEMVAKGYAKAGESAKTKQRMEELHKLMTRTDINDAEKNKLIQEGLEKGTFTQGELKYTQEKLKLEENATSAEVKNESLNRVSSRETSTSTSERNKDFANDTKAPQNAPAFTMSSPSGIETTVKLTQSYNATANGDEKAEKPNQPTIAPLKPTATVSADAAFG